MTKSKGKSFSFLQEGAKNADKVFPPKSEIAILKVEKVGEERKARQI